MKQKVVGLKDIRFDSVTDAFSARAAVYNGRGVAWTRVAIKGHRAWTPDKIQNALTNKAISIRSVA